MKEEGEEGQDGVQKPGADTDADPSVETGKVGNDGGDAKKGDEGPHQRDAEAGAEEGQTSEGGKNATSWAVPAAVSVGCGVVVLATALALQASG